MRRGLGWYIAGWIVGSVGLLSDPALGQPGQPPPGLPLPRINVVAPCGGRAGETVEVAVTGYDLDDPQRLLFSSPGLEATPLGPAEPPNSKQGNRNPGRGMRQALGPVVTQKFRVRIPADTPPGLLDLRLVNKWGASNPRAFVVGDPREVAESEPNNDVAEAQRIEINSCVNGSISTPTDVDEYLFEGKKSQRVLVSGLASSIDSRLLLAVELYDAQGRRLAVGREYQGTDALLDATLPADGSYLLRAFAFTYARGGPEHFYRLSVTTAPWIDAVFPPVIQAGTSARVTLFGRNLPGGAPDPGAVVDGRPLETLAATITAPDDSSKLTYHGFVPSISMFVDGFEYRTRTHEGSSNPYMMMTTDVPIVLDQGGNDTWQTAQEVAPPCAIAGRIERAGELDWYAFSAREREVWIIEGLGEQLGSPLDLYFAIRDARTRQMLVEVDDENPGPQQVQIQDPNVPLLFTRTGDPGRYRFVAPADGRYELLVSSREAPSQAGPRHLYVVRIDRPRPDFRLAVLPASSQYPDAPLVGRGGHAALAVWVDRRDGFIGEVSLAVEGLPDGVTCPPQVVGTWMNRGLLILSAAADASDWTGRITVKGSATVQGQKLVREARPVTITWPVPVPQLAPISRGDRSGVLAVRGQPPFRLTADAAELTAHHGDKLAIPLKLAWLWPDLKGNLQNVTAANLPPALSGSVTIATRADGGQATLNIGPAAPPGVYSLVFRAQAQVPFSKDPTAKNKPTLSLSEPSNPVLLRVIPRELARVTLTPASLTLKPGQAAEVTVSVSRLYNFRGEFRARLVLPDDASGLTAEEAILPEDMNQVKLTVRASADARPGTRADLTVRLTAELGESITTTQEAKLAVQVAR